MTRSGIEPTTSRSRGERSNHWATAAVIFLYFFNFVGRAIHEVKYPRICPSSSNDEISAPRNKMLSQNNNLQQPMMIVSPWPAPMAGTTSFKAWCSWASCWWTRLARGQRSGASTHTLRYPPVRHTRLVSSATKSCWKHSRWALGSCFKIVHSTT